VLVKVFGADLLDGTNGDYYGDPGDTAMSPRPPCKPLQPHRRWPRALNPFRSPRELSKSREKEAADLCALSITVSSPELVSFSSLKLRYQIIAYIIIRKIRKISL
jgi:hypothetical protein